MFDVTYVGQPDGSYLDLEKIQKHDLSEKIEKFHNTGKQSIFLDNNEELQDMLNSSRQTE